MVACSKFAKTQEYEENRKYLPSWESKFPWVYKKDNSEKAWCKICDSPLTPHFSALLKHANGSKHKVGFLNSFDRLGETVISE